MEILVQQKILNAIEYASMMGVKIINASFGSTQYNPALEQAMNESGIMFVTAAGNTGIDCSNVSIYPACFEIPTQFLLQRQTTEAI